MKKILKKVTATIFAFILIMQSCITTIIYAYGDPGGDVSQIHFNKASANIKVGLYQRGGKNNFEELTLQIEGKNGRSLTSFDIWLNGGDAITGGNINTFVMRESMGNGFSLNWVGEPGTFGIYLLGNDTYSTDANGGTSYVRQAGIQYTVNYTIPKGYKFSYVTNDYSRATLAGLKTVGVSTVNGKTLPLWSYGSTEVNAYNTGTDNVNTYNSLNGGTTTNSDREVSINIVGDLQALMQQDGKITINYVPISYKINYNANGGTGSTTASEHRYDEAKNLTANGFSKPGYIFAGWNTAANGTGTSYSNGQSVSSLTATDGATVNLYAQWTPATYTVTYNPNNPDANTGTVTGTMSPSTFTYATSGNLRANAYSRNAYSFTGWNTAANGTGTARADKATVLNWANTQGANINLYAQWRLDTRNINGQVSWSDQDNKYSSRPANVQVTLHHDADTVATKAEANPNPVTVSGNSNYSFNGVQDRKESNNAAYSYTVTQNVVPGYETIVDGYNITNNLIVPTYESKITYTPIDSFQDTLLKNGKVKVVAEASAKQDNRDYVGIHNGVATFTIDEAIKLDTSKIVIKYYEKATNTTHQITKPNYTIDGNVITVKFGKDANGISHKGDKITIETEGTLNEIKTYSSNITVTGKLYDYRGTTISGLEPKTNINLGEVTNTTTNVTVSNQLPEARIQIVKKDSITGENLADATFKLYEWNGSEYVEKETITDEDRDGIYTSKYYRWNKTTNGKYKIVETGIPENHKNLNWSMEYNLNQIRTENYTVKPDYTNSEYKITYGVRNPDNFHSTDGVIENEPYKIKAKIDVIDEETKRRIESPATFTIYEWDKTTGEYKEYISYENGNKVEMTRQEDKTYITGEWLYYTKNNEGKYRIIETTAPTGYYGDYNQEGEKRTYNINVLTAVGKDGQNNETTINISNNAGTFTNKRTKAVINVTKVDSETKKQAQADATIEGAIYQIYAKEDILHADGTTTNYEGETALLYKANELVKEQTTNAEGKLVFDDLECGKYYIKEKTASNGYLLDTQTHDVDVTYRSEEIEIITEDRTYEEKVKKQAFQIYKIQQDSRTEYEGLQNAGFTIYQISNLSIVKEGKISKNEDGTYTLNDSSAKKDSRITKLANKNGTYDIKDLVDYYYKIRYTEGDMSTLPQDENAYHPYNLSGEEKVKDYSDSQEGTTIEELKSDSNGYIRSPELAYGEYIVLETSVPKNLETATPFVVKVEKDSREAQKLRFIVDENFTTRVKIYKKDIDTKQTVLQKDVKYVIYNEAGDLMTTKTWDSTNGYVEYGTLEHPFTTSAEGYLITPMELPVGKYTIKEIEAPNGYVLNGYEGYAQNGETISTPKSQITFEISTNGIYYVDDYLDENMIVKVQENKAQVGSLKLTVQGEYIKEATNENNSYNFIYENDNVEGVKFEIRAKTDITTQDGHGTVKYAKDQIVQTITTNKEGIAYADNLPIGEYYIKQITAGNGFALNQEQKEFSITYGSNNKELAIGTTEWKNDAQKTAVINIEENYTNQRQKISIELEKIDEETKEKLTGAVFGIYAKNDIVSHFTNKVIVGKDSLIETVTTNEEGKAIFTKDLPLGEYYVKEITAPTGYIHSEETIQIEGNYNQDQRATIQVNTQYANEKTNINIEKTDVDGRLLEGAILQLKDSEDNIVKEWTTTNEAQNIKALKTGTQYTIVEKTPALGYVTAKDIAFNINTAGEVSTTGEKKEANTIIMKDETTKLKVELKDIKTGAQVEGATLKIVNANNEEVAKWTTTNEAYKIEKLPIGSYKLIQEKALTDKGYVTADEIPFEIRDTKEEQTIVMTQDITKLQVSLKEKDTNEQVVGATLQIKDKEGNIVVDPWITENTPHYIERLPVGTYILEQVQATTQNGYVSMESIEFEIRDTKDLQKVEMVNDITKLQVSLKDKDTGEYIVGSKLQIVNKETDEIVREWTTEEKDYYTERLPIGEYILKQAEIDKTNGNVTITPVEFEIKDTKDIQKVEAKQAVTKLEIEIVDKDTGEKTIGAKLQIINKTTGEVVKEFTSSENNYYVERLPVGEYIIKEVEIPEEKGYVTIEQVEFTIEDKVELQKVKVEQEITKLQVSLKDKDTGEYIVGSKLQIVNKTTGEVIREWTTEEKDYYTERLPIGEYILKQVEIDKTNGNVTTAPIEFKIENTKDIQKVEMLQAVSKVEVSLVDKDDKTLVEGAKLQIINKETEKVVEEWTTGNTIHSIERLPVGDYILKQTETTANKGNVTTTQIEFKIEDKVETQKVEMTQSVSKLQVSIKGADTGEQLEGAKLQIVNAETKEIVKEFTSQKEAYYVERLPIGKYILEEKEAPTQKGYVKADPVEFEIKDVEEIQKVEITNEITKLEVSVVDKETKEAVIGATVQIINKATEEVIDEWISEQKSHTIEKLPVGEYTLVQKEAPMLRGYVKADPVEFKIEETAETQKVQLEEDYTKVKISIIDPETKEPIIGAKVVLKTEEGKEIVTWTTEKESYELERIPVGKYEIEIVEAPYGYKTLTAEIEIKATEEWQEKEIEGQRETFDIKIEKRVSKVIRNGEITQIKDNKLKKVEIKDKKVNTEDIKIEYTIKISNEGKIAGTVGKVVENIPNGLEFIAKDNKGYWKEENGKVVADGLADKIIEPGAYAELQIVLKWKNGSSNFGTKTNKVSIEGLTNDLNFEEKSDNNIAEAEIIIGLSTGERNILYVVEAVLLSQILIAIVLLIKMYRIKM